VSTAIVIPDSVCRRGIRPPGLALRAGLLGLPEDRLAALHLREHELGAGKPGTIEQQVDRRSPPSALPDRRLFDDLSVGRPAALEAVAVDARGRGPRLPRLQHQPILERQPQQVRQLAVGGRREKPVRRRSCRGSVVLVDQPTEHVPAKDV